MGSRYKPNGIKGKRVQRKAKRQKELASYLPGELQRLMK